MFALRRMLGVAAAATTAVLAVLPGPAHAAADPYTMEFPDQGVSVEGRYTSLNIRGPLENDLKNMKYVFDLSEAGGLFRIFIPTWLPDGGVGPDKGCVEAGTTITCDQDPHIEWSSIWAEHKAYIQVKDGAAVGSTGKIKVTFSAYGVATMTDTATITVVDSIDLVAGPRGASWSAAQGAVVKPAVEVTNRGPKPAEGAVLRLAPSTGLAHAASYRNCWYRPNGDRAFCRFDQELEAGATYRVAQPVIKVEPDAEPGSRPFFTSTWFTADDWDQVDWRDYSMPDMKPGTGDLLRLEKVPATTGLRAQVTDTHPDNNKLRPYVLVQGAPATPATPAGGPTTGPTAAPTTVPATSVATPTATDVAGGGDGGGAGGGSDLPLTGTNIAVVAGLGGLLLIGGAVAFVAARRRRTNFTAS